MLLADGHTVRDFGTYSNASCDYPDWIRPTAEAVARGEFQRGIVLGGSGNGEAIVANKKFLEGWIVSFVGKKKRAPPAAAFVNAITELLDNMAKKMVLCLMSVVDARPLFMNRPSRLSRSLCRRNPLWPTSTSPRSRLCMMRTLAYL
jgi:hypothetical protein